MLYDGVCGLCDWGVQFILKRDHHDRFRFVALQSDTAATILRRHGLSAAEMSTFYIVDHLETDGEVALDRGRAILRVLRRLGGFWAFLGALGRIVPRVLLDAGYRLVSRNRYRVFGKLDACRLPTPAERAKFVVDAVEGA